MKIKEDLDKLLEMLEGKSSLLKEAALGSLGLLGIQQRNNILETVRVELDRLVNHSPKAAKYGNMLVGQVKKALRGYVRGIRLILLGIVSALVVGTVIFFKQDGLPPHEPTTAERYWHFAMVAPLIMFALPGFVLLALNVFRADLIREALAFVALAGTEGVEKALKLIPFLKDRKRVPEDGFVKRTLDKVDSFLTQAWRVSFWLVVLVVNVIGLRLTTHPLACGLVFIIAFGFIFFAKGEKLHTPIFRKMAVVGLVEMLIVIIFVVNKNPLQWAVCNIGPYQACLYLKRHQANAKIATGLEDQVETARSTRGEQMEKLTQEWAKKVNELEKILLTRQFTEMETLQYAHAKRMSNWAASYGVDDKGRELAVPRMAACADGADNDGDGKTDKDDPGCKTLSDNSESEGDPLCADRIDNDGDGLIDKDDPKCNIVWDRSCTATSPGCTAYTVPVRNATTGVTTNVTRYRRYVPTMNEKTGPPKPATPPASASANAGGRGTTTANNADDPFEVLCRQNPDLCRQ